MLLHNFGLNTTKNEFVHEDGSIVSSAEKHAVLEQKSIPA